MLHTCISEQVEISKNWNVSFDKFQSKELSSVNKLVVRFRLELKSIDRDMTSICLCRTVSVVNLFFFFDS